MNDDVYCSECLKKMKELTPIWGGLKLIGFIYMCEDMHTKKIYFERSSEST